jgi:hypothetical protein
MEFDKLLAQTVAAENTGSEEEVLPDWVSKDNASYDAWKAINSIKNEKFAYISKHKTATKFRVKKTYQVQKQEVADAVGASTQALFYTSSYSENLLEYLEGKEAQDGSRKGGVNGDLMKRQNERIAKPRTGVAALSRPEVNKTATSANERIKELEAQNAADQLTLALAKLPLTVRNLLKLG